MNQHYLIVSALGENRCDIIQEIAKICLSCQCSVLESRIMVLGDLSAFILYITGNWSGIAKLETILPGLKNKLGLSSLVSRASALEACVTAVPYAIQVISVDRPGIIHEVSEFFYQRNIQLVDLRSSVVPAARTHTPIFSMECTIHVPKNTHIPALREQFMVYCDDKNLDAILEPQKN